MGYPKSHSLSSCYLSDSHFWGIPVGPISGHAHRNLPGLSVNEGVDKYPVSMLEINFVTWQCFASPSMLNVQELSHALFKCGSLSRGRNPKEWVLASIFQYKHISIFISLSLYIYITYLLIFHICILYIYIIYIYQSQFFDVQVSTCTALGRYANFSSSGDVGDWGWRWVDQPIRSMLGDRPQMNKNKIIKNANKE